MNMPLDPSERLLKPEEVLQPLDLIESFRTLDAESITSTELATRLQGVSKAVSAIAVAYGGEEPSGTACLFQDILPELQREWPNMKLTEVVMRCYLTQGAFAGKILVARAASGADAAQLAIHHRAGTTSRISRPHEVTHDIEIPGDKTLDALLMQEPYTWREGDYYARDLRSSEPKFAYPFKYDPLSEENDVKVYTEVLQSLSSELLTAVDQQHPITFIKLDDAET